jgi:hypothetical protein
MSTCAASVNIIFSTGLVLPTLYQQILQQLFHLTALVSYYLHYINKYSTVISFFSKFLVLSTICQLLLQRLLHFSALVSYYLHYVKNMLQRLLHFSALVSYYIKYVNMCCNGYYILQHWSRITYNMSTGDATVTSFFNHGSRINCTISWCASEVSPFTCTGLVLPTLLLHVLQRLVNFQHWTHIPFTMSTCAAAVSNIFSTGLVLPTLCLHVLQRLLHFSGMIRYYIQYIYMCCSGHFIIQHCSLISYTMSARAQRLLHFRALVSYYLQYVHMFCSVYFIFQHCSRIAYSIPTCAAAVTSFYSTGLLLPTLFQHVLQRLLHFSALVSYYLHYDHMSSSGYLISQHWSLITYTM